MSGVPPASACDWRRPGVRWLGRLLTAVLLAGGVALPVHAATPASAAAAGGILVFEADDAMRPAYLEFFLAFRSTIAGLVNEPAAIYAENFDLARLDRPGYVDALSAWHCAKYRDRNLRVLVTIGAPAFEYALRWREACAPGVQLVFANLGREPYVRAQRPPATTGLVTTGTPGDTVRIALELVPHVQRIAVVGGPTDSDVYSREYLQSVRAAYGGRAEILDLTGLPMPVILERVSRLPPDSIVLFTSLWTDGAGRTFISREAGQIVARTASVPTFGIATTHLGYGIVGGRLLSPTKVGHDAAELAARVYRGEPADSIPLREDDVTEVAFDAQQMERWGLDVDAVPPGSRVINRRESLWEEHRNAVIAAVAALFAQALLIGALLRERQRRQRVNVQLRRLSGELINSQENERRRVARELHDDVGQQLALLSIELDQLRKGAGADIAERLAAAAARADAISVGVHGLARDLHPARLETLGLPTALRALADEVRARHGIDVRVALGDWPAAIADDAALTLYRVAQEALQNCVKHAGATTVSIDLRATPVALAMTVADDGRGFATDRPSTGIGLAGMAERVALVGGALAIDSAPGDGTRVRVTLPRDGDVREAEPSFAA